MARFRVSSLAQMCFLCQQRVSYHAWHQALEPSLLQSVSGYGSHGYFPSVFRSSLKHILLALVLVRIEQGLLFVIP